MALKDTLNRRKAKGQPEGTFSPFTPELRYAVSFDVQRAFEGLQPWMVQETIEKNLRTLRMDIIQHVFNGIHPNGMHVDAVRELDVAVAQAETKLIRAYILDAPDDLQALDTVAFSLRHLTEIALACAERGTEYSLLGGRSTANAKFIISIRDAVKIVNERLAEGQVGYFFSESNFIRSSEPELFKGAMEPCLLALQRYETFQDTDKEFRKALDAWKHKDYKQAVHHSGESLEGMLRVLVKELVPEKHDPSSLLTTDVQTLTPKKLWHGAYQHILKGVYALRGDVGAHSEATKARERLATEKDAEATVYLTATMLVFLVRAYEDHSRKTAT